MKGRLGTLAVVLVTVAVGAFIGSAFSQRPVSSQATSGELPAIPRVTERVRVEVLNGSGREGMARGATDLLREFGFDVVYFGNARDFSADSSVVLDRVGRVDMARAVADALGIRTVVSEPDSNLFLDVSVVLGAEWSRPVVRPVSEPTPPWWSPRRWFAPTPSGGGQTGPVANPAP